MYPRLPLILTPQPQYYHWGKVGSDSLVAKLINSPIEQKPYAELWVGAHPQASSIVTPINSDSDLGYLKDLISSYPLEILGHNTATRFCNTLPFLFKILSVAKPLSIQAHPDKALAKILHSKDPLHYPDANHKPEIAIAISELKLLYGFKPILEIKALSERVPELAALIHNTSDTKSVLASIVSKDNETLRQNMAIKYIDRLKSATSLDASEELVLEIAKDYGEKDIGIFTSLILNLSTIKPGQAIYVGPGVPHAYLSGDLAECMANSDNVVRGGITPKFQDIDTLIEMLDYKSAHPIVINAQKDYSLPYLFHYDIPTEEFSIERIDISTPLTSLIKTENRPIVIFTLSGSLSVAFEQASFSVPSGRAIMIPACLAAQSVSFEQGAYFKVSVAS